MAVIREHIRFFYSFFAYSTSPSFPSVHQPVTPSAMHPATPMLACFFSWTLVTFTLSWCGKVGRVWWWCRCSQGSGYVMRVSQVCCRVYVGVQCEGDALYGLGGTAKWMKCRFLGERGAAYGDKEWCIRELCWAYFLEAWLVKCIRCCVKLKKKKKMKLLPQ